MFSHKTKYVFVNKLLCFTSAQAHHRIHARAQPEQMALATGRKVGVITQFPTKIITVFGVFPRKVPRMRSATAKILLMEPRRIRRIHSLRSSLHRLAATAPTAADLSRQRNRRRRLSGSHLARCGFRHHPNRRG